MFQFFVINLCNLNRIVMLSMFRGDSYIWHFYLMWCVRRTNGVASIFKDIVVILSVFVLHDSHITQSDDILHESNFQNVKAI